MTEPERLLTDRLQTPTGPMRLVCDERGRLRALDWEDRPARSLGADPAPARDPFGLTTALTAYFEGALDALDGLAVEAAGTAFQREVWAALREIPRGETWSYKRLAERVGRPKAMRAVGLANGANPVALVVPCHRVIGADRGLTGYGGGLERKRWLLAHEGALPSRLV